MKKILILIFYTLLGSCAGYEPILNNKNVNFYIGEIVNKDKSNVTKKIITKLKPYRIVKGELKINLEIESTVKERVISRDSKGDAKIFEKSVQVKITSIKNNVVNQLVYFETFSFNNQSNKFELNQYKKNIESTLINRIFEQLIIDLR
tara:strand:+ start:212 stop:655 length:444 start_codon:yes stop_codon:yes gene_type:complete